MRKVNNIITRIKMRETNVKSENAILAMLIEQEAINKLDNLSKSILNQKEETEKLRYLMKEQSENINEFYSRLENSNQEINSIRNSISIDITRETATYRDLLENLRRDVNRIDSSLTNHLNNGGLIPRIG